MLTPAQMRAARGLLDWTRADLAKASGLSQETIKNVEHGSYRPQETTTNAIVQAFAMHNVELLDNEGVVKRKDTIRRYEGPDDFRRFMDDVYAAACAPGASDGGGKPICVSNVDDSLFVSHLGEYAKTHVERMNKLHGVKVRVLTGDKNAYTYPGGSYLEYRYIPCQQTMVVPFYVYGDMLAIVMFGEEPDPQVLVISSEPVARAYREQFEVLWQSTFSK